MSLVRNVVRMAGRLPVLRDPKVRRIIRQRVLQPARRTKRRLFDEAVSLPATLERYQVPHHETFFGYYDCSPLSKCGSRLLAHIGPQRPTAPVRGQTVQIGYFDRAASGDFIALDTTSSWCWQLGARLRWFPDPGATAVIYNKLVSGTPAAVIRDVTRADDVETLPGPIFDVSRDGSFALSLSFARLSWARPGYGYEDIDDPSRLDRQPPHDGIWRMDMSDKRRTLILSLDDVARFEPASDMDAAYHYVNAICINPVGKRFSFLHVWLNDPSNPNAWSARALTANCDGSGLFALTQNGRPSHYAWRNDHEILLTIVLEDSTTEYRVFEDRHGAGTPLPITLPKFDGHPSFSPDGHFLLTDSYPDDYGEQCVLLYSLDDGICHELGRFLSKSLYTGDVRCDLHPRWDHTGQNVVIDSAHHHGRAIYILRVPDIT